MRRLALAEVYDRPIVRPVPLRWIAWLVVVAAVVGVCVIAVEAALRLRPGTAIALGFGALLVACLLGRAYGLWVLRRGRRNHPVDLGVLALGVGATTAAVNGASSAQLAGAAAAVGFAMGCFPASRAFRSARQPRLSERR